MDTKRIKLQTNPPGSAAKVKVRQAPPVELGARRPVVLQPVAYDQAQAPGELTPEQVAFLGQMQVVAGQLGYVFAPIPGGRPPTSGPSSSSEGGRPPTSPTSSSPPSGDVAGLPTFQRTVPGMLTPDQRAMSERAKQHADRQPPALDDPMLAHMKAVADDPNLPPEARAEAQQLFDALSNFADKFKP